MTAIAEKDPKNLVLEMADMARSDPPLSSAFVAELTRRLQGQGPALALPLTWIEQRLSEDGLNIVQLVRLENQRRAEDQVSVSNSISSLRFIHAMDWREFVGSPELGGADPEPGSRWMFTPDGFYHPRPLPPPG